MKNRDITDSIIRTIKNPSFSQAILIDGEWGSGKTYYVKNELKAAIEEVEFDVTSKKTYKVGYFSLNGLYNINDLKSEVLMFTLLNNMAKSKFSERLSSIVGWSKSRIEWVRSKVRWDLKKDKSTSKKKSKLKASSVILNVANPLIGLFHIDISKVEKLYEIQNYSSCVLIFDDLERCLLPISQVMGFINYFCEHLGAKVIIVSNQDEIGLIVEGTDLPSKYSVILSGNLDVDVQINKKKDEQGKRFSIDELERATKEVFSRNNEYKRVKEKLVGMSIKFIPDLAELYDLLLDSSKIIDKQYFVTNKQILLDLFAKSSHYNLRTISFFISSAKDILGAITVDITDKEVFDLMIKDVLVYIAYSSIIYKLGFKRTNWDSNSAYMSIKNELPNDANQVASNSIAAFKFVDLYVQSRFLQDNEINETISEYLITQTNIKRRRQEFKDLSFYSLENWINYDDVTINKSLSSLLIELNEDKYDISEYQRMISFLDILDYYKFDFKLIDYIDVMLENIKKTKIDSSSRLGIWYDPELKDKQLMKYYKSINDAIFQNKNDALLQEVNKCLNEEDWSIALEDYVKENRITFITQKAFLSLISDVHGLAKLIHKSNSKQIMSLCNSLNIVYSFSNIAEFFESDLPFITELCNELSSEKLTNSDKTASIALDNLTKILSDIKEGLNG